MGQRYVWILNMRPQVNGVSFTSQNHTCRIDIHVFLWRNRKNMNHVFRLVNPAYDMDTYICKLNVFTKQANYE